MIKQIFFFYFLHISKKPQALAHVCQGRNEFCMQKYPKLGYFYRIYRKQPLFENFRTGYSMKIAMLQPVRKFSEKRLFSVNPIKIQIFFFYFLIRVFLHAEFISAKIPENGSQQPTVFEKYAENRKKYLLSLFSIFCDFLYQFQAKFPKTK